ncbi:hypothetical protein ACJJIF_03815 [Microbulbifer sp. SSSA002]|uniref:hypothetical protein n=1 Tax=unclassified Microbulbifer TaxID=2619833 RepID=UPI00403A2DC8
MREDECSDSWFIVTTMAIFFFLFQWLEIYSITTIMQCDKISDFWLTYPQQIYSPFYMVAYIFGLIFVWSLFDVVRAIYLNFGDKVQASVIFIGVTVCTIFIARGLWAQWEHFEITNGFLKPEDSVYLNVKATPFKLKDPRSGFIKKKKCETPFRTLNISSGEGWKNLESEFISQGGTLPWR